MLASFKAEVMAVADHAASTIESIVHPHWISVVPHGPLWSMTARQSWRPSTLEFKAMRTFALVMFITLAAGPALAQDASLAYRGTGARAAHRAAPEGRPCRVPAGRRRQWSENSAPSCGPAPMRAGRSVPGA